MSARNPVVLLGHEEGEMEPDDSVLWSRSAEGDTSAFALLFERHAKAIYNYCFRRIGDWSAAEDLLSVVFLEAWRRRDKELPPGKVLPWLYGIATNVVRNRRRAERRYRAALARVPAAAPAADFAEEAVDRADDERQLRRALDLLAQLPRRQQDVFVLCAWSSLSYEDAAFALGVLGGHGSLAPRPRAPGLAGTRSRRRTWTGRGATCRGDSRRMSRELWVPTFRDLPGGRLTARAQHLRAEIARERRAGARRTRLVAAAALVIVIAAALLATPAFGLRDRIVNLFTAEQPEPRRPPELIQRYFRNMFDARPGESTGVVASKARVAIRLAIPGFGHKTLWVAPTRAGGYCSNVGCNRTRSRPFEMTMEIAGPTSTNSSPVAGSRDQHVFFYGDTSLRRARGIAIQFEDGTFERTPLVWVSKPIDAGFFLYLLPKSHWKPGKRPITIEVDDAKGHPLARDYRVAGYFLDSQRTGLAPPPKELNRLWLLLPLAAALLTAATLVLWRRRGS